MRLHRRAALIAATAGLVLLPALAVLADDGVPTLPESPVPGLPGAPTAPEVPELPPADPEALVATVTEQAAAIAEAAADPANLENLPIDIDLTDPEGNVTTITTTLEELAERLGSATLTDPSWTGIADLPEISAGNVLHTQLFTRVQATGIMLKSAPNPLPSPTAGVASMPAPWYHTVQTSDYVPATPLVPGINPLLLSPVPVPAEVPDEARTPLPFIHYGGKLINVQGAEPEGWDARCGGTSGVACPAGSFILSQGAGAKNGHLAGNIGVGSNVDTAPTPEGSDFPIWFPLVNSSGTPLPDTSMDFLGFGIPVVVNTCVPVDVPIGSFAVIHTLTCVNLNLLLGDGTAVFNGSPVDFNQDLAPLWSPAPPVVTAANAAIAAVLAQLPTGAVLDTALGLLGQLPEVPETPPLPVDPSTIPALPALPAG